MLANDEHDFFPLYLTSGLADLEQMLRDADFSGDVVAGYLTKAADEKIAATFQQSGFNRIVPNRVIITYELPPQQRNPVWEYAIAADVDQLSTKISFRPSTNTLITAHEKLLAAYVESQFVIAIYATDTVSVGRSDCCQA